MRRFVIIVDTQVDFMDPTGALYVPGAQNLITPIVNDLAARTAHDTAGLLFTFDTHQAQIYAHSAEALSFPPHCLRATSGWENVIPPARMPRDVPHYGLEKSVFDMWAEPGLVIHDAAGQRTDRDVFFNHLKNAGIETITVMGVAADYCVRDAIAGCVARGFHVTVPRHLTRGITRSIEDVIASDFPPHTVTLEDSP